MFEAREIAKNVLYVDKNQREIWRYQLYVAIQSNSKKKYKVEDVFSLPWDNKWLDKTEFKYNEEEEKKHNEMAQSMADLLNNGGINFESTDLMKKAGPNKNITN